MKIFFSSYLIKILPAVFLLCSACSFPNWEQINFRRVIDLPAFGYKLSHLDSVEAAEDRNELILYSGGRAVIYSPFYTQVEADFFVNVEKGDGIKFFLRTSADTLDFPSALTFEFSRRGSILSQNGIIVHKVDSLRITGNEKERIRIQNDGDYLTIIIGCERFFHEKKNFSPATEYIGLEPLPGSTVKLYDIAFIENEPRKYQLFAPDDKSKNSSQIKY